MKSIFLIALWGVGAAWPQAASNCQRSRNIRKATPSASAKDVLRFPRPTTDPTPAGVCHCLPPCPLALV